MKKQEVVLNVPAWNICRLFEMGTAFSFRGNQQNYEQSSKLQVTGNFQIGSDFDLAEAEASFPNGK